MLCMLKVAILLFVPNHSKKLKQNEKPGFDNLMKALLSVPHQENKEIKEKTKKERKKKEGK